jgi:hypothetical protein
MEMEGGDGAVSAQVRHEEVAVRMMQTCSESGFLFVNNAAEMEPQQQQQQQHPTSICRYRH